MKKNIKYFFCSFFIFASFLLGAQHTNKNIHPDIIIDSLLHFVNATNEDSAKVRTLNLLSKKYIRTSNYEPAMQCALKAEQLAVKIDRKKGMALAYNNIGTIYNNQGNYKKALNMHLKALKIMEEINDSTGIANSYVAVGIIYHYQQNYPKAMELYLKSLIIYEKIDDKTGIANFYNNAGIIYDYQSNYSKALDQYFKSLKIYKEIGDEDGIATAHNNIGYLFMKQGNDQKALYNFLKATEISEKNGNKRGSAVYYNNIGQVYTKQGKFEESFRYLNQALMLSIETQSKDDIKEVYSALSELYNKKGDFKKAFEYHKLYSEIKDSLLNEQSGKQIAEMDAKYDSEKKEKDIELLTKDKALQQADINKQKFIRNGFIAGLLLALFLTIILYNRFVIKQKLNTILKNINKELIQKNALIEKQKEKIIDSITYAQLIQQSILIEESEIQKHLPDSAIYYQSKDIVSGDFYWFSKIDNKIIIAAIDCTGHGVPGAFMSMIGNTLLNQIVNEKHITTPSEILRLLNIGIYEALHQEKEETLSRDGMDIALCCIDHDNNQLEYAGAQNPLYVVSGNELVVVKADRQTIGGGGMISKKENPLKRNYTNHVIPIKKGLTIYLFSDGYMDQFRGSDRKKFGIQKFKELIVENQHLNMQKQKELFAVTHEEWKGKAQQIDDILIIGIRL